MTGWFYDPYNSEITEGLLMNQSEQEKYDAEFPDHPLTKTRQLLDELKAQIIFSSDFKDLKLFEG